jgi:hypothetical protein
LWASWANHLYCQQRLICSKYNDVHKVIELVLVGSSVADLIGIRVHVVGINTITTLLLGSLDSSSHDGFDVGETGRSLDVEPPFIPTVHLVLGRLAQSVSLVVGLTGTTITGGGELESVLPDLSDCFPTKGCSNVLPPWFPTSGRKVADNLLALVYIVSYV